MVRDFRRADVALGQNLIERLLRDAVGDRLIDRVDRRIERALHRKQQHGAGQRSDGQSNQGFDQRKGHSRRYDCVMATDRRLERPLVSATWLRHWRQTTAGKEKARRGPL